MQITTSTLLGTWHSCATKPKIFVRPDLPGHELIVGIRHDGTAKSRYFIFIQTNGKKQYISSLFADYWKTHRAYNFNYNGIRLLWQKVKGEHQVQIKMLWRFGLALFLFHVILSRWKSVWNWHAWSLRFLLAKWPKNDHVRHNQNTSKYGRFEGI